MRQLVPLLYLTLFLIPSLTFAQSNTTGLVLDTVPSGRVAVNTTAVQLRASFSKSQSSFTKESIICPAGCSVVNVKAIDKAKRVFDFTINLKTTSLNKSFDVRIKNFTNKLSLRHDAIKPSAAIRRGVSANGTIQFDVNFSEDIRGFEISDFDVKNSSIISLSGGPSSYRVLLKPERAGRVSIRIPLDKVQDIAGNTNDISNQIDFDFDNINPTPSLRALSPLQTNSEMNLEMSFDEDVVGLDISDFDLKNATIKRLSGSGRSYNLSIAGITQGEVMISLPTDRVKDAAGNGNKVSNQVRFMFDPVPPTVELMFINNQQSATSPIREIRARFTEQVSGFEPGDMEIINGAIVGELQSSITSQWVDYIFMVAANTDGQVTISLPHSKVQDLTGNLMINSSNVVRFNYDSAPPIVELSYRAVPGPAKILSQMVSKRGSAQGVQVIRINSANIEINATFSEDVLGFKPESFLIKNATIKEFAGTGTNYRILINPIASGFVELALNPSTGFKDLAGNVGSPSNVVHYFKFDYDGEKASAVLASSAPKIISGRIPVSVEFNESVEGFLATSVRLSQGRIEDFVGSGKSFKFSVVPTAVGPVEISLDEMTIRDMFGNVGLQTFNKLSFVFDDQKPSVEFAANSPKQINTAVKVELSFSEDVTGLDSSDIILKNASLSQFMGAGSRYSFLITPSNRGAVSVALSAGAVSDAAGNPNTESQPLVFDFDDSGLTAEMSSSQGVETEGPIDVKLRFNKGAIGFSESSIIVTQGAIRDFRFDGREANFLVVPSGTGQLKIEINGNGISDVFGNQGLNTKSLLIFNIIEKSVSEVIIENGKLIIRIKGQGNQASIWRDGDNYYVQGKNLLIQKVEISKVKEISVDGSDHADQEFKVLAGASAVVTHPLNVSAAIERVVIAGPLLVSGDVNIESGSIIIASNINTTGRQIYGGEVEVSGDREIRSDHGEVIFKGFVRASNLIFYDPDSVPVKASIHNFHPLIQVERQRK